MKRFIFTVLFVLLVPVIGFAGTTTKTQTFGWTYTAEEEAEITGFVIYQLVGTSPEKAVISNIPKTARFATGTITYDNGAVNRFYIRAVNNTDTNNIEYSDPSNTVRFLASPGQFKRN
jgi:hypothetical protein